jgi:hypothetical protein
VAFAALLAACSSGSAVVHTPAASTPGLVATVTVGSTGTSASLAGGGTTSTGVTFPGASAGVGSTLTLTASTTAPEGATGASVQRSAQTVSSSILEYILIQSTATATFAGTPALSFVLSSSDIVSGAVYTLEEYNSTDSGAGFVTVGTGSLSGSTLSFAAGSTPLTIAATPAYVIFALKMTVTTTPSPSPTPTVSPSPGGSPTPVPTEPPGQNTITATTQFVTFAAPTASPQSFTVNETNGAPLIESDTCTSGQTTYVTISPTGTSEPNGESLLVTLTPVAVGTCSVKYQDPAGNSVSVGITVSNPAPIVIQGRRP